MSLLMQKIHSNPGIKSIEGELFDALCKAGAVSKSNSTDPKKIQLMRAARTDKGVHAACNLVSLKMICSNGVVEKLNDLLPKHFRIWGKSLISLCTLLLPYSLTCFRLCGNSTEFSCKDKV